MNESINHFKAPVLCIGANYYPPGLLTESLIGGQSPNQILARVSQP